jgi:hypothetical protein
MAINPTDARGVEAVNYDTATSKVVHRKIKPKIKIRTLKKFNNRYGMGAFETTLPVSDQVLHPLYIEYGDFELVDNDELIGKPEDYPDAAYLHGVVGNIILRQLRSGAVVRELYLKNVQAFDENDVQIMPADFYPFYKSDTPVAEIDQPSFRSIHVPLKGAVVLNLLKIPAPEFAR